jgi:lycopene cyclase domain-containing protein
MLGSLAVPLLYSFENEIRYYKKMKYLLPAIIFTGVIFIIWDIRFESLGIWSFNPEYLTGIYIINLPVEEWLFFIVIPYCCVFIYEILKVKLSRFEKPDVFLIVSIALLVAFAFLAYFARQKLYTFFTFFLLTIYFGYTIFRNHFKHNFTKFYLTYLISLIPFMIVNGLLTRLPVVIYDNTHNLGVRLFTIPVEDFGYLFLLLLMNITIYEYLQKNFRFR